MAQEPENNPANLILPQPDTAPEPPPAPEVDTASKSLTDALQTAFVLLKISMALAIAIFFLRGFFQVSSTQTALVQRFGAYRMEDMHKVRIYQPGHIYYAVPMIDTVEYVDMSTLAFDLDEEFSASPNPAPQPEGAPAYNLTSGRDRYSITGDANILHSKWTITYRVKDISQMGSYRYLTSFAEQRTEEINKQTNQPIYRKGPEQLLRDLFSNAIIVVSAGTAIDDALVSKKDDFIDKVRSYVDQRLEQYDCGIEVVNVTLPQPPSPPAATKQAFADVTSARSEYSQSIDKAQGEANSRMQNSLAQAKEIENEAEIYCNNVVASAKSDADNITELLKRFPNDPTGLNIYLQQYHLEIVAELLSQNRHYIVRPGQTWFITGTTLEEALGAQTPKP
jgi:regulator of protease activity HflC (stomatin/prohibitin superfamily)